jgi:hypothetical protein
MEERKMRMGLSPRSFLPLLLVSLLVGCQDLFLPDEPGDGPVSTFEFVWEEMDRHYSFFELKGVDWDAIYEEFRPWVGPHTPPSTLFEVLVGMMDRLKDGHVTMKSPFSTYRYSGWYRPYPHNFDLDFVWFTQLAQRGQSSTGNILYGYVRENIGYIYIPTFMGSGWVNEIDGILENLEGIDALVVDVRDNAGGSDDNSEAMAGRFVEERVLYRSIQYRNGPDHDDFTAPKDDYLEPAGRVRFRGPVALLTNRRTYSAAESFVLAMRVNPNVTVVGDTTGGGSGNPIQREMPNGWTFTLSRWIERAPDGTTHEGVGLNPDLPASIPSVQLGSADRILQTAIQHLWGEIL